MVWLNFTPRGGNNIDFGQGRKRFHELKDVGGCVKKHFNEDFQRCNIVTGFLEEYYQWASQYAGLLQWKLGKGGSAATQ